ncbi:MAG: hypothetical protein V3G42_14130 [Oscillospiraceae bacterium]
MKIELIIPDDYADCLSVTAIGNRSGQLKVMSRSFQIRNRDKQTFRLATNEDSQKVQTKCMGQLRTWNSREEAKAFFRNIMMESGGDEKEHYMTIYMQLCDGLFYCTDKT